MLKFYVFFIAAVEPFSCAGADHLDLSFPVEQPGTPSFDSSWDWSDLLEAADHMEIPELPAEPEGAANSSRPTARAEAGPSHHRGSTNEPALPPSLEARFRQLLEAHQGLANHIPKLFEGYRPPAGYQSERIAEMLEDRFGPETLPLILEDLKTNGSRRSSYFFYQKIIKECFSELRQSGGTDKQLRDGMGAAGRNRIIPLIEEPPMLFATSEIQL